MYQQSLTHRTTDPLESKLLVQETTFRPTLPKTLLPIIRKQDRQPFPLARSVYPSSTSRRPLATAVVGDANCLLHRGGERGDGRKPLGSSSLCQSLWKPLRKQTAAAWPRDKIVKVTTSGRGQEGRKRRKRRVPTPIAQPHPVGCHCHYHRHNPL